MTVSTTKKTIVITGCSSGIGKALAKKFHAEGYEVFAGARRLAVMSDLAELGVHTYELDVTSQESVDKFRDDIEPLTHGKLNVLINNAGQACMLPALDVTVDQVNQCFDVNFNGVVRMSQAFTRWLIAAKGKIIQVGSVAGIAPFPFGSVYGATKAALHYYSSVLRLELLPFGVEVLTVVTGGVDTNIQEDRGLPEGSLFIDAEEGMRERKQLAKRNKPMSADVYATQVYNSVARQHVPEFVWYGTAAGQIWFASNWLPRWLMISMIAKHFKLDNFYKRVKERFQRA